MKNDELIARLDDIESACRRLRKLVESGEATALYETSLDFAKRRGVSVYTVRRWAKNGMPCAKPSGKLRIPVIDAQRWLDSGGRIVDISRSAVRAALGAGA